MGLGVAECFAAAGIEVRLTDATPETTREAKERLVRRAMGHAEAGLLSAEAVGRAEAVETADDAQRAVRRRMLRADVEGHALGLELDVQARVGRLRGDVAQLLPIGDGRTHAGTSASASASGSTPSCAGIGSTSTMPGHGLTMRASRGKSLRNG